MGPEEQDEVLVFEDEDGNEYELVEDDGESDGEELDENQLTLPLEPSDD